MPSVITSSCAASTSRRANGTVRCEPDAESAGGFAVRMGLRYVKGLGERSGKESRERGNLAPFALCKILPAALAWMKARSARLAEAGAFDSLHIDRRTALWDARRLARMQKESLSLPARERQSGVRAVERLRRSRLGLSQNIAQHAAPSARADAAKLDPPRLAGRARGGVDEKRREDSLCGFGDLPPAAGTAGGVVFMTLEDETGFVNVVDLGERLSALCSAGEDREFSRHHRQDPGGRRRGASGRGRIVGAESRIKTGERGQPGFSLTNIESQRAQRPGLEIGCISHHPIAVMPVKTGIHMSDSGRASFASLPGMTVELDYELLRHH